MVFCLIAIVAFGILGIFSAKYRTYFKESLRCVTRQMTLRKCDTDFDNKMKSKITAKLMIRSPAVARFVYKRFSVISWIFIILMVWSLISTGIGIYNFVVYGNCNGEDSNGICIFNPTAGEKYSSCGGEAEKKQLIPPSSDDGPYLGGENAKVTIIEFGCFVCEWTKKSEPVRKQILEKYGNKVKFVFKSFLIASHNFSNETAEAAYCALDQKKYWEFHDKIFESQNILSVEKLKQIAVEIGLDADKFNQCFDSEKFKSEVEKDYQDGLKSGIYGTPTFFINDRSLVGPKSIGEFSKIIDEELAKKQER